MCSVTIVVAVLLTVTQLMAEENRPPFDKYRAITKSINEIEVAGVRIRYSRDDDGCVKSVEFYNDPAEGLKHDIIEQFLKQKWYECAKDQDCKSRVEGKEFPPVVEPGWVPASRIDPENWPKIWGEYLVGAGSTKGESGSKVCNEWRFTLAGSPGWDCTVIGGDGYCACIGRRYGLPDWPYVPPYCCDGTHGCVPHR